MIQLLLHVGGILCQSKFSIIILTLILKHIFHCNVQYYSGAANILIPDCVNTAVEIVGEASVWVTVITLSVINVVVGNCVGIE